MGCLVISYLYLFQEIALFKSLFYFFLNFGIKIYRQCNEWESLVLFIMYLALDVTLSGRHTIGGPAAGLAGISGLFNISDTMQSFRHDKSSSISPLTEGKSKKSSKIL